MEQSIETLVIGGGQAGLSASYYLNQHNREHVVLELSGYPGSAWRDDRWDSFTLVTPNWTVRLPGAEYSGDDPDGFLPRREIIALFERYAAGNRLPLQYGVRVTSVDPLERGYRVTTSTDIWKAKNVIIATGMYQQPKKPAWHAGLPGDIHQAAAGKYRNPAALPAGAVLVVGSGQSGCQIAEELYQSGRVVYLSVGSVGRAPRRYRGKDIFEWLYKSGFVERTADKLPSPRARFAGNPQLTGKDGGHSLNLHQFYRDGVTLLGRVAGAENGRLHLASDLKENLAKVDQFEKNIIKMVDDYIQKNGIDAPEDQVAALTDGYQAPEIASLDLKQTGISTVIWAMGYDFDFSLVKLPVFDEFGFPVTVRGATHYPGLFFLGLPWLTTQKSGLLMGVGEDAAFIAERL